MDKQADDYYAAASEAAKDSKLERTHSVNSSSNQVNELELAGLVAPTEDEMDTLRHVSDKINWSAYRTLSFTFPQTRSLTWVQ
jgi:POT family proton-dependent oligopeptide transporter